MASDANAAADAADTPTNGSPASTGALTPAAALNQLDQTWFATRAQWMDVLIYSGQELFVLDGDALVQYVLDDSLLAFAKDGDPSLQLLHATWLLERTVDDLLKKDTAFEIVFFDSLAHSTYHTGASEYVVAARRLARSVLLRRANLPQTRLHRFDSLDDEKWQAWYQHKRPMYVLGHDGGIKLKEGELEAERILLQRHNLYETVHQSLPYVLLQAAELTDTKINSYFYDVVRGTVPPLPSNVTTAVASARSALDEALPALPEIKDAPATASVEDVLRAAGSTFFAAANGTSAQDSALLYLYFSHVLLLPTVPLRSRAQRLPTLSKEVMVVLEPFLTRVYASLTAAVEALPESERLNPLVDFDLDGRIFFLLLVEVLNGETSAASMGDFLGPEVASRLTTVWSSVTGAAEPDFAALRSGLPAQTGELAPAPEKITEDSVLPYSSSIFTEHLATVKVTVAPDSTLASLPNKLASESVFSDERGWSNPKPALPTHLGGAPPPVLDYRAKKKRDRKEQRFMAQMQKSAASLTGALGGALKQQAIPAVGKRSQSAIKEKAALASKASRPTTPAPGSGAATPTGSEAGRDGNTTGGRGSKRDKPKVLSSREKLIAENALKKIQEEGKENYKWWVERLEDLKALPIPGQISQLDSYLRNKRAQDPWLHTEMLVKRMDLELRKWIADDRREAEDVKDQYRVFLARTASPLLQKYLRAQQEGSHAVMINEKQGRAITTMLFCLGLECLIPEEIVKKQITFGGSGGDDDKKDKKSKKDAGDDDGKKKKSGAKPGSKAAQANKKDATASTSSKAAKAEKDERAKLTFHFCSLIDKDEGEVMYEWMEIDENPLEWQLRNMGEYMARELDSQPDPR
ncbi:hypothetical protein JCM3774_001290, partial [Rhodotorula dairenensis]